MGYTIYAHDPLTDKFEIKDFYGISLLEWDELPSKCDVIIIRLHKFYKSLTEKNIITLLKKYGIVIDVKSLFQKNKFEKLGHKVWSL